MVGYIGDGINDAPSLHSADVGISVSNGVDVAKAAADIILLEKSLAAIYRGVVEGRRSFGNITKYVLMGTSSNFGNMLSMAVAAAVLPFLPLLPAQILLNNFLYDVSQLSIPTDNVDASWVARPRKWDTGMIQRFMFGLGPISSLYDFLTFGVMLWIFHAGPELFRAGWFIESLATQTLVIFVIRTAGNPFKSRPSRRAGTDRRRRCPGRADCRGLAAGCVLGFAPSAAAVLWRAGGDDGDLPGSRPGSQAAVLRGQRLDRMRTAGTHVGGVWAGFSHLYSVSSATGARVRAQGHHG